MTIGDGAVMPLSGTINNTGTIALNSTGDETDLQLIEHGVTLQGGGQIVLSDSDANVISGTSSSVTLDNEDNTISGAGQLGNGELTLTNAGTIDATGTHALTIDTGSNLVMNSGVLEASGSGGMTVASGIVNSGVLWANGATLTVQGQVAETVVPRSTVLRRLISRPPQRSMWCLVRGPVRSSSEIHSTSMARSPVLAIPIASILRIWDLRQRPSATMKMPRGQAERWQFRTEHKRSSCL